MRIMLFAFLIFPSFSSLAQTFRNAFDNYESGAGGAFGQGFSFDINIYTPSNGLHVMSSAEPIYLESYLTMFKTTKDKRYLDKFIIHSKRIQTHRDDFVASNLLGVLGTQVCSNLNAYPLDNNPVWSTDIDNGEPSHCDGWISRVLHSAGLTFPMAEFVYFMQTDPDFIAIANESVPTEVLMPTITSFDQYEFGGRNHGQGYFFHSNKIDSSNHKIFSIGINLGSSYEIPKGGIGDPRLVGSILMKFYCKKNTGFSTGISYDMLRDHKIFELDYYGSVLHRKTEHFYSLINIPATFFYSFNKFKFAPLIEAGLQASMLVKNEFTTDDEIFHTKEEIFRNGFLFAFCNVGIGAVWKINSKWGLILDVNYFKSLIPLKWEYTNQIGETVIEKVNLSYYRGTFGIQYSFIK